jgi:hypothetical protein
VTITAENPVDALKDIASRARCLPPPSHARPHAFHEGRSELAHEIDQVGRVGADRAQAAVNKLPRKPG